MIADQILSQAGFIGRAPWVLGEDERRLLREGIAQLESELERYRKLCKRLIECYDDDGDDPYALRDLLYVIFGDVRVALEGKQ